MDYYLKFDDQAAWDALALEPDPGSFDIDVLGVRYRDTGDLDDGGLPIFAPGPGWFVNIRCLDDRDLSMIDLFRRWPTTPDRIWAPLDATTLPPPQPPTPA